MPYIKQKERPRCDKVVQAMVDANIKADGDLHYILFKFAKYHIEERYNVIKNFRAELRECADEIKHRLLNPYEETVKEKNGDV